VGEKMNTSVNFCGLNFKNPVITASGTFNFGREYGRWFDLNLLGGITVKGLTLKERLGNRPHRIAETPSGVLNCVGLQNPGVTEFIDRTLPELKKLSTIIIANLSGASLGEYAEMARLLSDSGVDMLEMNVSCPNVKEGGMAFGASAKTVFDITAAVRKVSKKPFVVKLSPNVTDIAEIARAAEAGGADGLSLINTVLGMAIDTNTRRPVLSNIMGGLSGPAVKPVAVRMVWQVKNAVNIPIIGMGGITSGNDAIEFILAGASLVAVGTAMFADPMAPVKIIGEISDYMRKNNIDDINSLIGGVVLN
jgi:dihydroorotate dehydrogenase (NAD+) catalytic subunit